MKTGHGQLSLVEHSLCPLDPSASLTENLVHTTQYHYMDASRHQQTADVRIFCPLGLSANDELFLWGLLSLTLTQPDPEPELHATPHYCLRQLGQIDQNSRRGGRQYQQFAESLSRLGAVVYQNDRFYDPIRAEHRRVSFGFLSYSLPLDENSSRAWRIAWNPLFFELVQASAGHLRFDLATYRSLDPASRRLFLLLTKIFQRRPLSPRFDLHHLAINVLGFSPTITAADLKKKVRRCVERLVELRIVASSDSSRIFEKEQAGRYRVLLERGSHYDRRVDAAPLDLGDSALGESLAAIGLDDAAVRRLARDYPLRLLQEWADVTLAAKERFGNSFFKRSAAAYFVDNIQNAGTGSRTPPDWWQHLRNAERLKQADEDRRRREAETAVEDPMPAEAHDALIQVAEDLFKQFQSAGQPTAQAWSNAQRFAADHIRRARGSKKQSPLAIASTLQSILPSKSSLP